MRLIILMQMRMIAIYKDKYFSCFASQAMDKSLVLTGHTPCIPLVRVLPAQKKPENTSVPASHCKNA